MNFDGCSRTKQQVWFVVCSFWFVVILRTQFPSSLRGAKGGLVLSRDEAISQLRNIIKNEIASLCSQ